MPETGGALLHIVSKIASNEERIKNMKTHIAAFAVTLCFVSSLAVADSPTDAPLLPDNEHSVVVQHDESAGRARKRHDKKDACSFERSGQTASSPNQRTAPRDSQSPSQTGASPSL
jgi:hypothetical protein